VAFEFSLNALLRLRQSLEKAELQRLQGTVARCIRVRLRIGSVTQEIKDLRNTMQESAARGVTGAELHFQGLEVAAREKQLGELRKALNEVEQLRQKQLASYRKARQRREIISNLRQRELEAYQLEQARRQQQQADELFLMRWKPESEI